MDSGKTVKDLQEFLGRFKDGFLLVAFLSWLALYIICGKLSVYSDMEEKDFVSIFRAALNVLITSIVLTMTYIDRFRQYSVLVGNANSNQNMPELSGLFLPLAFALVPFTSAMTDLADSTESSVLIPNVCLVLLLIISLLETAIVCEFERSRNFVEKFTIHIFLLMFLTTLLLKSTQIITWFLGVSG